MSMAMAMKLEMGMACEDSTVKCRVWSVGTALLCSVAFIERIIDGNDKTTLKDLPRATLKLHAKQRWLGLAWPGLAWPKDVDELRTPNCEATLPV